MLLPFIATVGWKKRQREVIEVQEDIINSHNERIMVGSVSYSTLPCAKLKGMFEKLFYIYKSTWYELSPPSPSAFSLFVFPQITISKIKMAPAFIDLSTAFCWNLRCFSPWKYIWTSPQRNFLVEESKPLPQIFQHGGRTKQDTNKKQLQPVTWFCLLFPIYIN